MRPLFLVFALSACAHAPRPVRQPLPGQPTLEVMTWNLNFGMAGDAATIEVLEATTAELLLLQETTPRWEAALRPRLSRRFPHQHWLHSPGAGGLAVLSTRPVSLRAVLEPKTGWFPALRIVAMTGLGPVQALLVHLRPPVSDAGDWVDGFLSTSPLRRVEVLEFLSTLEPGLPTLVAGDFNEGTSGEAVSALEARGFRSVLPEFAPRAKTWGWDVGPFRLSAQLDHLVASVELDPLQAKVLAGGNSDHQPVVATFVRSTRQGFERPAPSGGSLSISVR